MRRVYVLNDGGHNYQAAERFGDIVFCTRGSLAKWDISQMFRELELAMMGAEAEDFILVSGLASLVGVASAMMAARFGEVHFLIFKDGTYVQRDLMLEN